MTFRFSLPGNCLAPQPITVQAVGIAPSGDAAVPKKIRALFEDFDANKDGRISMEELTNALNTSFPNMPEWAKAHLPVQFEKYASESKGLAEKTLDHAAFTKLYAAFLFRNFDANGDGILQISEAEEALRFLADGKPIAVPLPVTEGVAGEKHVSKLDFWLMFKAMMQ